jgi:hypothetical protein
VRAAARDLLCALARQRRHDAREQLARRRRVAQAAVLAVAPAGHVPPELCRCRCRCRWGHFVDAWFFCADESGGALVAAGAPVRRFRVEKATLLLLLLLRARSLTQDALSLIVYIIHSYCFFAYTQIIELCTETI